VILGAVNTALDVYATVVLITASHSTRVLYLDVFYSVKLRNVIFDLS